MQFLYIVIIIADKGESVKSIAWIVKSNCKSVQIAQNKIWTFEPEYGKIHIAVLGFFLEIEGGVHMGKDLKGRELGVGIFVWILGRNQ